eukprot:Plantae.Rhodophyta-Purpureofilum_apyrenoidigerum.ctg58723.p1 GENE.Plantae.Rhodophyta-Purpureofilum_apyrenoidigerum.ctg58723~~Plantae.Rhodophyta-Purpureofilum_apyrenoidigerum.ctg58723.p1  ORF type:complete len:159 (+),score=41.53 Plantae.Rhodophyta-Purpureofilum_apyrenoidigerum.ctg58723:54-479(+)
MAFVTSGFLGMRTGKFNDGRCCAAVPRRNVARMAVSEVASKEELNKVLDSAGESLVVIDYSTSWCGPCKIIAPKFEAMSEDYEDVVFLKVMGDKDDATAELMKSEAIRAVPAFHFWKSKEKIHTITGARTDDIQASIDMYK